MLEIPQYEDKSQLFAFLKKNKQALVAQKKYGVKHADSIAHVVPVFDNKGSAITKDIALSTAGIDNIEIRAVINTTNLLDSHGDVHIPGLWKKSLTEKKLLYLLQEHQMKFDKIISDEVLASTIKAPWKQLGFDFKGSTEALLFHAKVNNERNQYMFDQYIKGYVKNHSVGMQYVNLFMCINSEEKYYIEEKEYWDKYISEVVNIDVAEENGYFWAVTEAKIVEGSAVPIGSNYATPTISVSASPKSIEPGNTTQNEPPAGTQNKEQEQSNEKSNQKINEQKKRLLTGMMF